MNRLNKTDSAVFLYCWFSLFLKDPFSRLFITVNIYGCALGKKGWVNVQLTGSSANEKNVGVLRG